MHCDFGFMLICIDRQINTPAQLRENYRVARKCYSGVKKSENCRIAILLSRQPSVCQRETRTNCQTQEVTIKGGLLQKGPALIFSDAQKVYRTVIIL